VTKQQQAIYKDWRSTGDPMRVIAGRHGVNENAVQRAVSKGIAAAQAKRQQERFKNA